MPQRIVAMHQPFAYPWLGYLAKIADSDVFIYLEQVQFQVKGYMRRNYARGPQGRMLLSIPCEKPHWTSVDQVRIAGRQWADVHKKTFETYYARAPYFGEVCAWLFPVLDEPFDLLADLVYAMVDASLTYLGIETEHMHRQAEFAEVTAGVENPTERLVKIVQAVGGDVYRTGRLAIDTYMEKERFADAGLGLDVQVARPEPYEQCFPGFEPNLMAVDAMMCLGPICTVDYMRCCFTYEVWNG